MTTDNQHSEPSSVDSIEEQQNALDTVLEQPTEPDYYTAEQVKGLISEAVRPLKEEVNATQAQARKAQGAADRSSQVITDMARFRQQQEGQYWAQHVPEDQRDQFSQSWDTNVNQAYSAQQQEPVQQGPTIEQRDTVQALGISPDNPNIDWSILNDTSVPEAQRSTAFVKQAFEAHYSGSSPASPSPNVPEQSVQENVPQSTNTVQGNQGAPPPRSIGTTQESLMSGYLSNKYTLTDAKNIAQQNGWNWPPV